MGMEPFDYLTYKKNKQDSLKIKKTSVIKKDKMMFTAICFVTFSALFLGIMLFVGSKSSKMDIEYGRLGKETNAPYEIEMTTDEDNEIDEDSQKREKITIDKRLFMLQQEEKGPSKSKVVDSNKEQSEVISKKEFDQIKTNSEKVIQKNEASNLQKPELKEAPITPTVTPKPTITQTPAPRPSLNQTTPPAKVAIKPKLPVQPTIKPMSAINAPAMTSKVLVGRYQTLEDARFIQGKLTDTSQGVSPFVKRINNYYSVQIGAFESFETAKSVASKYKANGYDVWILQ